LATRITALLTLFQVVGLVFYGVFSAVYILALPSIYILTNNPILHLLLTVFGGLFLALAVVSAVIAIVAKKNS
jgi:hypothetical protein